MTHAEKITQMEAIFAKCLKIADAKGRDYSGTEDSMSNFRDFGATGIIVRLGEALALIMRRIDAHGSS